MNPLAVHKPQTQTGNVQLLVLLHAGFVLTGLICTMLGPPHGVPCRTALLPA
jgi:hypothetical protein